MESPSSYVEALRKELEHAPVQPTVSEETKRATQCLREERIEPKLVAAMTSQGRFAAIHNTKASPGETLPAGLFRSKTGFLLVEEPVKAKVDGEKIKKEMALLERVVVIGYFVGGQQGNDRSMA
jgi:hypothetical protein